MPSDCETIRVDKNMKPSKKPFPGLKADHGYNQMIASADIKKGNGPYEVRVRFRDPQGRWRSGTFTNGRPLRADISPKHGFIPSVEVENKSDDHLELAVCLDY